MDIQEQLRAIDAQYSAKEPLPSGISAKDADTLTTSTGDTIRLKGVNARETSKFLPGKKIEGSQLGADTQTRGMEDIIREGYTTPILTGEKDIYGRQLGDFTNQAGKRLSVEALQRGIIDPYHTMDKEQQGALYLGDLERATRKKQGTPSKADLFLEQLNQERGQYGLRAKEYTATAKQYGASLDESGKSDFFAGPAIVRPGETKTGEAISNWDTGIEQGLKNTAAGWYGAMDLLATKTGSEYLNEVSKTNLNRIKSEMSDLPYLKSGEAFNDKGEWQLKSLGQVLDYTVGTAASSAPQMVTSLVAALASPLTYGASMTVPAAIYTGQVWNEQKDKNATAAILSGITQAVLDKVGLEGIGAAASLNITRKATQDAVVKELVRKGATKEVAEQMVVKATKESVKDVTEAMRSVALKQNLGVKAIGKAAVMGSASEGLTEGLQEIAGYLGEQGGFALPTTEEEKTKLKSRLLNAVTGGAVLGGVMAGTGKGVATLTQNKRPLDPTTDLQFRQDWLDRMNQQQVSKGLPTFITMPTVTEIIEDAELDLKASNKTPTLDQLSLPEVTKRSTENITTKTKSALEDKGIRGLWDKFSNIIMQGNEHKSIYSAALATALGAGKPVNGASIDEHQDMLEANIFKNFGNSEQLSAAFGGVDTNKASSILNNPEVVSAITKLVHTKNNTFSDSVKDVIDKIDFHLGDKSQYMEGIVEYADKIDNFIKSYNNATGNKLSVEDFLKYKPLDKTLVSKNSGQFIKDLQSHLGMSPQEAQQLTQAVLDNDYVSSFENALDELLNSDIHKVKSKDQLEKKIANAKVSGLFDKYMSHNVLDNAYSLASSAAAINTNRNIIGKDGSKLAGLIQAMLDNGDINGQQAGFMAKEIKDFLDIRHGKYHAITNPYLKGGLNLVNFLSTISSLPLAAISSTVEFAQVYRNLNKPQSVKATKVLLTTFGKEFGALFREIGNKVDDRVLIKQVKHRQELSEAGYLREGGIGHRNDILISYFQKWTEGFFKVTGLTSVTAITRHARLAMAADAIENWVNIARNGIGSEQEILDAKEHLVRLGVDLEFMMNIKDDTAYNEQRVKDNLQRAAYNFVNEAVVIPKTLNRPKFYSDPYLRLFTQFQGYTSTFTANVLPRLISDLGKKGSDDQRNSAAVIAMMIALSMLALYLKDMIKYGESPPDWLKDDKKYLRVLNQTGLLGSGQRVFDQFFPMFEGGKSKNIAERIAEQSPQLAYLNKVRETLEAPENKRIEKGAKLLPIFGTSPAFAKYLQKELGD